MIANPGGINEKFVRTKLKQPKVVTFQDNTGIFDEVAAGKADLMITDASAWRLVCGASRQAAQLG